MELILTGKRISAEVALQWGLVNYVVPAEELLGHTKALLGEIFASAPIAVTKVIASINAYYDKTVNGFAYEIDQFEACMRTEDFQEGITAFF